MNRLTEIPFGVSTSSFPQAWRLMKHRLLYAVFQAKALQNGEKSGSQF
ncbi:hypothetical protein [Treponema denticola]|nr:hypothetical protein [Treponema denticola]UTC88276.1 hypothetical protein E4N79_09020 [Treponema denticola]